MKDITNYLEKPHVDAMLQIAAQRSTRDYLMLRVLWRTGVRVSELQRLRPHDIDLHHKVVDVTDSEGTTQRQVPLDSETIAALCNYAEANDIEDGAPLFPLSKQWIRHLVHDYGMLIGVDTVHPYTLRHSFAIHSIRHGVDIRHLQRVLGHASLSVTAPYLQFMDQGLQEAYADVPF